MVSKRGLIRTWQFFRSRSSASYVLQSSWRHVLTYLVIIVCQMLSFACIFVSYLMYQFVNQCTLDRSQTDIMAGIPVFFTMQLVATVTQFVCKLDVHFSQHSWNICIESSIHKRLVLTIKFATFTLKHFDSTPTLGQINQSLKFQAYNYAHSEDQG